MKKLISYIFPIYNESGNIDLLYETLNKALKTKPEYDYELIFINDGSKDNSLELLKGLQVQDKRIGIINFSRNFGHQFAITAGLDNAQGDAVILMDSDLQDPPSVSLDLIDKWQEGYDVVYAQRKTRQDSFFKKLSALWFYAILQKMADINIPRNTGDFRLLDRRVVDTLKLFNEHSRFLRGLVSYVGYKQINVLFDRDERHSGETGYTLKKMLRLAGDGIFGFSVVPLKLISYTGLFVSSLSLVGFIYVIYIKLFNPHTVVQGWTFVVASVLLIGGIQLIALSVIGSYVGRIYIESQNRPLYISDSVEESQYKSSERNKK
jgi:glycosyltransferase involved in cell wall biosynthesis